MTIQKTTLIVDEADASGNPLAIGNAFIAPSARIPDPVDGLIIGEPPLVAAFHPGVFPSLPLYPCDLVGPQQGNGLPGWSYNIWYTGNTPGTPGPWSFYLLSTNGTPQRLSRIAPTPVAVPGALYLPFPVGSVAANGQVPAAVVAEDGSVSLTWQPNGTGADKTFTTTFSVSDSVMVNHNLGKYPAVNVFDTAGSEIDGDIDYIDLNNVKLGFSAPFAGTVTCN